MPQHHVTLCDPDTCQIQGGAEGPEELESRARELLGVVLLQNFVRGWAGACATEMSASWQQGHFCAVAALPLCLLVVTATAVAATGQPVVLGYTLVASYPHSRAFTEGLVFDSDCSAGPDDCTPSLWESTGASWGCTLVPLMCQAQLRLVQLHRVAIRAIFGEEDRACHRHRPAGAPAAS